MEVLDPGPAEAVLEIGCGPGVAAALVCERLGTGQLLALNRSPVAVTRTAARNAAHVAAGRLEVRQGELAALAAPMRSLDSAFALNVNLFWVRDPGAELAVLRRALRPGGVLRGGVAGPTGAERVIAAAAAALGAYGFTEVAVIEDRCGFGVSGRVPLPE